MKAIYPNNTPGLKSVQFIGRGGGGGGVGLVEEKFKVEVIGGS